MHWLEYETNSNINSNCLFGVGDPGNGTNSLLSAYILERGIEWEWQEGMASTKK